MDEYMLYASTAETCDVPYEWMTPAQIKERWPLVRTEDLKGAIYHPTDGYINPADVTMAMAKGARQRGVIIERKWQVDGYEWTGSEWRVTQNGEKRGNLVASDEQTVTQRNTLQQQRVTTHSGPPNCWVSKSLRSQWNNSICRNGTRSRVGRIS